MKLIDADALIERYGEPCHSFLDVIEDMPTIDAALVVRGEFERQPEEVFFNLPVTPVLCKTCNTTFFTFNKEGKKCMCCPYCGARMDGEADD